uniref:Uncharacterized protein n=1 Tax=Haptolina ericina TaxID=156174 RepID=A0A7S3ATP5_9EUKA|mmetsp:Transcript_32249/g.72749  ORF Transcript_32249/g.72749 Transcript_32249/m.72749 type:complete len:339 (+) Transcript_32249:729-1745(+)
MTTAGARSALAYNDLAAVVSAMGDQQRALMAYEAALEILPQDEMARTNLAKLPVSPRYRAAATEESEVLAHRAAAVAMAVAAVRRGKRSLADLGLMSAKDLRTRKEGAIAAHQLAFKLHRVVRFLRRLETEQADDSSSGGLSLSSSRATEMPDVLSRFTKADGTMDIGAFAWGGVWYHTFAAAFTHHDCRAALQAASRNGGSTVVLGSSIGFEAYFAALTFGLPTVGVELLCGLVDLSNELRDAHAIPPQLNRFECANALTFSLPQGTALVYVDDTAWDAPTIDELGRRLVQHLPAGVVVIHNTEHGYTDPTAYRKLQAVSVGTSWNPAHTVHVHITV